MDARLNFLGNPVSAKFIKHVNAASAAVMNSGLPAATAALVEIRASQINGCGFCTDMHTKDALHAGESVLPAGRRAFCPVRRDAGRRPSGSRCPL